jgi:hypothetical protein
MKTREATLIIAKAIAIPTTTIIKVPIRNWGGTSVVLDGTRAGRGKSEGFTIMAKAIRTKNPDPVRRKQLPVQKHSIATSGSRPEKKQTQSHEAIDTTASATIIRRTVNRSRGSFMPGLHGQFVRVVHNPPLSFISNE